MMSSLVRWVCIGVVSFGFLLAMAASEPPPEGQPAKGVLTVQVVGAKNAKGKIGVALFQGPTGFPENASAALRQEQAGIDSRTMSAEVIFRDVPQGVYAVSVFHDENANGKLDKNFLGIPMEGYGASNNPGKKMRAPTFDEAKFSMNSPDQKIEIKLIY
jgi:uncharacterized protein (DUF2141 family)